MAKSEHTRKIMRRAHTQRHDPPAEPHWRPSTRADCMEGPRPCPFVACRHNLLLEVTPTGSLKMPHDMPWEVPEGTQSCALDVADTGEHSLADVATFLGSRREVAHRGLQSAVDKLRMLRGLLKG